VSKNTGFGSSQVSQIVVKGRSGLLARSVGQGLSKGHHLRSTGPCCTGAGSCMRTGGIPLQAASPNPCSWFRQLTDSIWVLLSLGLMGLEGVWECVSGGGVWERGG
jgi:hypothetical protein